MATPPLIHPSAPPSTSLPSTTMEQEQAPVIPIAVGIPSLPSTTADIVQVCPQRHRQKRPHRQRQRQSTPFGTRSPNPCICCKAVWSCLQMWTPISTTFLLYWLIYRPDRFHPRIDSAVLAAFDITNAGLQYDLTVDMSFRNSHRLAIRYLDVAASVFYDGTRLGPTDDALPSFIQPHKNTTVVHTAFHGVVTVDPSLAVELQRELDAGTVHLRITVSLTLMYKVLFIKDVFFYKYDCWLWFPPPGNHTPALFYGDGNMCWHARA